MTKIVYPNPREVEYPLFEPMNRHTFLPKIPVKSVPAADTLFKLRRTLGTEDVAPLMANVEKATNHKNRTSGANLRVPDNIGVTIASGTILKKVFDDLLRPIWFARQAF